MFIEGNISMGMRARLVTPTTAMNRQMTTMKYGLRMAKPDMGVGSWDDFYGVFSLIAVTLGRTSWPDCNVDRPVSTTLSPSLRPDRISTLLDDSIPSVTFRFSTRLLGVTIDTCPVCAAPGCESELSRSTAMTGTASTLLRRSSVRSTSAYIPGIRMRLGLATSPSVSMVRVATDTFSTNRGHGGRRCQP